MCTVTFVKNQHAVIITSNRDEQVSRKPALPPNSYVIGGQTLYFPKDTQAGGSWIVFTAAGSAGVLLNGAAEKHEFRTGWRRSRGLVLLDLMSHPDPLAAWESYDFDGIEPFTLILYHREALYQLRWDALCAEQLLVPIDEPQIWSSSPLYEADVRLWRQQEFHSCIGSRPLETDIYDFHMRQDREEHRSIRINRGGLKTLSVTQAIIQNGTVGIQYHDLRDDRRHKLSFTFHR